MPRNIDPKIDTIDNVILYSIDDLDTVVKENMQRRQKAVFEVEKIIDGKLTEFYNKIEKLSHFNNQELRQSIEIN